MVLYISVLLYKFLTSNTGYMNKDLVCVSNSGPPAAPCPGIIIFASLNLLMTLSIVNGYELVSPSAVLPGFVAFRLLHMQPGNSTFSDGIHTTMLSME
jgi:hypothetical protein